MEKDNLKQTLMLTKENIESFVTKYSDIIKYGSICLSVMSVCGTIVIGICSGYNNITFTHDKYSVSFTR